jgi:hypothetical protein
MVEEELFQSEEKPAGESKVDKKRISHQFEYVKKLLEENPAYRDNDEQLVVRVWKEEIEKKGAGFKYKSILYFFRMYEQYWLTPADSITRARRKVQQKFPELEGKKQKERRVEATKEVKGDLKSIK